MTGKWPVSDRQQATPAVIATAPSGRSTEGKLTVDRLEFHSVEIDPERTYEQPESGPSTECARAPLLSDRIHRDERSEDRWGG